MAQSESESKGFQLIEFKDTTSQLSAIDGKYPLFLAIKMFDDITKLFDCLGSAMSIATSDVMDKLHHVRSRTQEMIDEKLLEGTFDTLTIEEVMLAEKSKNWHTSGPDGIDGKGKEYQCASRSIVRLIWFLDFVYEMIAYMRQHEQDTLQTAVRHAYATVLSDRHSALIRNAFKVIIILCPSKSTFLSKISGTLSSEQVSAMWVICEENMKKISEHYWNFLKSEQMDDLP